MFISYCSRALTFTTASLFLAVASVASEPAHLGDEVREWAAQTVETHGSRLGEGQLESVRFKFNIDRSETQPQGWDTRAEAALAFYKTNDQLYLGIVEDRELIGFLVESNEGRYYHTTAAEVPSSFQLSAAILKPRSWSIIDTVHTHPGGQGYQETFSVEDRDAVLAKSTPGYYLRTPLGDIRFIDRKLARRTSYKYGAYGVSVCREESRCMERH